jgi:hypothetical protein
MYSRDFFINFYSKIFCNNNSNLNFKKYILNGKWYLLFKKHFIFTITNDMKLIQKIKQSISNIAKPKFNKFLKVNLIQKEKFEARINKEIGEIEEV